MVIIRYWRAECGGGPCVGGSGWGLLWVRWFIEPRIGSLWVWYQIYY